MARAKQPARGTPKEESPVESGDAATVPTETEEALEPVTTEATVSSEDLAPVPATNQEIAPAAAEALAVEEARAPAPAEEVGHAAPELETVQIRPAPLSTIATTTSFQTIVAEMTDYSRRSLDNGSVFVRKLLGAKSLGSAILIQSEYAKTSYVDLVAHLTKVGALYSKLATEILERRSRVS